MGFFSKRKTVYVDSRRPRRGWRYGWLWSDLQIPLLGT